MRAESNERYYKWRRLIMKDDEKEISDGLNQIFEIINAKGDVGELKEIVKDTEKTSADTLDYQI
jgi:hypothetical protein